MKIEKIKDKVEIKVSAQVQFGDCTPSPGVQWIYFGCMDDCHKKGKPSYYQSSKY